MNEYRSASGPTQEEIRLKYNRFAPWYDLVETLPEILGGCPRISANSSLTPG
jgi:hypothetical protein